RSTGFDQAATRPPLRRLHPGQAVEVPGRNPLPFRAQVNLTSRTRPAVAEGPADRTARRLGNACLATVSLAVALMALDAFLGPSNTVPRTGGLQLSLALRPSAWLTVPLVWTIAALSAVAPGLGLLALRKGWRPAPRPLLLAAMPVVALLAILP